MKTLAKRNKLLVISRKKKKKTTNSLCLQKFLFFSFSFFFLIYFSSVGVFLGLERIAFLLQTYLACKIISQLPHVFAGHISKTSLDATCLITHLVMPIPILLECAMNEIKRNIKYFVFPKNEFEKVIVKDG